MKARFCKDGVSRFASPLAFLSNFLGEQNGKVVFNISDENIRIYAKSEEYNVIWLTMDNEQIFSELDTEDTEKVGVYFLGDFAQMFGLFAQDEPKFTYIEKDEIGKFSVEGENAGSPKLVYTASDVSNIDEGPKKFKGEGKIGWWAAGTLSKPDLQSIKSAASVLQQDLCFFRKSSSGVTFEITDDIGETSWKRNIDLGEDVKLSDDEDGTQSVFRKETLSQIINTCDEMEICLNAKIGRFDFDLNTACNVTTFLGAKDMSEE